MESVVRMAADSIHYPNESLLPSDALLDLTAVFFQVVPALSWLSMR